MKEGEDESDENRPLILDQKIVPTSVVIFKASDEFLLEKLQNLPEKQLQNTHFNEKEMLRRLNFYRKINNNANGQLILNNFFAENKIDIMNVNLETLDPRAHFSKIQAFIERNGKFKNYQSHETKEEHNRIQLEEILFREKIEKQKALEQKMEEKEKEKRLLAEEQYKLKMEDYRKQKKNILDKRSQPLRFFAFLFKIYISFDFFSLLGLLLFNSRDYLNHNVVPFVSEGLFEIYKSLPSDPVDFLVIF